MKHAALALALFAAGCSYDFPGKARSYVYLCETNDDCAADYACTDGYCVAQDPDSDAPPRCAEPVLAPLSSEASVFVGFPVTLTGTATAPSSDCGITDIAWWVCNAPLQSRFAGTSTAPCQKLADGDVATFTPDKRGSYRLELRARAGDNPGAAPIDLEGRADVLFVELTYSNPAFLGLIFALSGGSPTCLAYTEAGACDAAPAEEGCAWVEDLEVCWSDCADPARAIDEAACVEGTNEACSWNEDTLACDSKLTKARACYMRSPETCTGLADCEYEADLQRCSAICSAALNTEALCDGSMCQWDEVTSTCNEAPYSGFPETMIAAMYSDGSDVAPVRYRPTAPMYRFDPNDVFTASVSGGTGLGVSNFGLGFSSEARSLAMVHAYMYTRQSSVTPGELECSISQAIVYWRQGDTLGEPSANGVHPLSRIQSNLLVGEVPESYEVAYPSVAPLPSGPTRVVFGAKPKTSSGNMSECSAGGAQDPSVIYNTATLPMSLLPGPLSDRTSMPLQIAQVPIGGAPIVRPARAPANVYPCNEVNDCPPTVNCVASKCDTAFSIEGYLPKLYGGASAVLFNHASCTEGYGAACRGLSAEHDLYAGLLIAQEAGGTITSFDLNPINVLAADPDVSELDAFVAGDVFSPSSRLYYLGTHTATLDVTIADGAGPDQAYSVTFPEAGLYRRTLQWTGSGWTTSPAAATPVAAVVAATHTAVDIEPTPCKLDSVADRVLKSTYEISSPMQFTLSANGRFLAYALVTQRLECVTPFSLGGPASAVLRPADVLASKIYVIDFNAPAPAPMLMYGSECEATLAGINLMPQFISGDRQVVFTSRDAAEISYVNRFHRMNTDDLGGTTCQLEEVLTPEIVTAGLHRINPTFVSLGATLGDSRTSITSCGGCSSADATLVAFVGMAGLWRLRRRRARQS